ncbi:MAG: endonuclease/exonuclease/phosphatase family protein [Bacteroidaceae bacterium]|nr:endonuclease/exonuclease/phosphatase family protein [Bacteroidaceae bacterium]
MKRTLITYIAAMACLATAMAQRQKPITARIMTFNIRTETKVDGRNNWELRYQPVAEFVNKSKSDIVGMQEVQQRQLTDLCSMMGDYSYVGVARDDGKQKGEYNPIFYRKERFNLLRSGTFWLSPTPAEPSYGWGAACRRIATWAILQEKTTMKSIIVLNTHLDHISEEARANGAALIKERLSRMNNELPVVVTGDMNSDDKSTAYAKFATAIFPMQDAYKTAKRKKGPDYTFHGFGQLPQDNRTKIDYIFLSSQINVKKFTNYDGSLGEGRYLSDHNALTADIVY